MASLSPYNLLAIKHRFPFYGPAVEKEEPAKKRERPEEVVMYRCPVCDELHEWEDDAVECCQEPADQLETANCPVCGEGYHEHRDAADCCLWKDIPALERWRIADAVEAGSDWKTELGL